ncbi:MAG: family 10 glycosylhydrolase, partial [Armatimonadetes bacterium]|nr:family 10 glycosylhydrolase [Armatimonadota bacterium]
HPAAGEFRGAWLHWQDYVSPQAIARTVQRARRARLNVLLPLANYPDQAMWQSRLIPVNGAVRPGFDPLCELVAQAHAAGLQIHPYLLMLNGGLTRHPAIKPDWYAVDARGRRVGGWLNPSHPEVREFLCGLVAEVAATGVDGIHYDYIRHEDGADYDYSDLSRQKFHAEHGFDPLALRDGTGGTGMRLLKTDFHLSSGAGYLAQQQAFLSNAGFRPDTVLEANLAKLRRDTVLVAGNLYSGRVRGETIDAMMRFAEGGGVVVILDGPEITTYSQRFTAAVGLGGKGYFGDRLARLTVLDAPEGLTEGLPRQLEFTARGNACPNLGEATLLALFDDGTPAITLKSHGLGWFLVFNFHCYQGQAADDPSLVQLFAGLVDRLAERAGIVNTARLSGRLMPATWDRWRLEQVSSLVRQMTATARQVRPDIITSAAGGTQREDLTRFRRDGLSWLRANHVQFLCPMAYTTDNTLFARRLEAELRPVDDPALRRMIFAGIGVYKSPGSVRKWLQQIQIARSKGLRGVCFFAFEDLSDALINALAAGPFSSPAAVPWSEAAD